MFAPQEIHHCSSLKGVGIAQVVRLVDNDESVIIQLLDRPMGAETQLVERNKFHTSGDEVEPSQERHPR